MDLSEGQIEIQICHYLHSKKIFFWKNSTGGYFDSKRKVFRKQASPWALNGAPDLICIIGGLFVGLEIKSAKGRQSESQKAFQERVAKAQGLYYLVRSVDCVKTALQWMKESTPQ